MELKSCLTLGISLTKVKVNRYKLSRVITSEDGGTVVIVGFIKFRREVDRDSFVV